MISKYFLLKMLFSRTKFSKAVKKMTLDEVESYRNEAVLKENFELASYLSYYLEFKKDVAV